jgi:hypothetical protein
MRDWRLRYEIVPIGYWIIRIVVSEVRRIIIRRRSLGVRGEGFEIRSWTLRMTERERSESIRSENGELSEVANLYYSSRVRTNKIYSSLTIDEELNSTC